MATIAQVREELPDVTAKLPSGKIVFCHTAGRKNQFATICNPQTGLQAEVSWPAIAKAVTTGNHIIV